MRSALSLILVVLFASFAESQVICNQKTGNKCVADCEVDGKNLTLDISNIITYPRQISVSADSPDADTVESFVFSCSGDDNKCGDVQKSTVCLTETDSTVSSCGNAEVKAVWELIQTHPNYLFIVTYIGGDCQGLACKQSQFTFIQTSENDISVDFIRMDMAGASEVYLFDVSGPCVGQPNCKSPSSPSSSLSGSTIVDYIILSILTVSIMAVSGYCIIGSMIMYFRRGARGKEVIPNFQFWMSSVGVVKVGCLSIVRPCHKQSYSPL